MHPQICLHPLRKEAEGIKYVHVEFWRGSELSEVKQIQVWKCNNLACQRIFPLTARKSVEKKASSPWEEGGSRTIVEKPCCVYCESIDIEPVFITVKIMEKTEEKH